MKYALFLLITLIAAPVLANPSVVCVATPTGKGSATYIGDGLFVTAYHVVEGDSVFLLTDPRLGLSYPAQVVAVSAEDDLAILRSPVVVLTPSAKVAKAGTKTGDRVSAYGYGQSYANGDEPCKKREWSGSVQGYGKIHGSRQENCYTFSSPAIPGDSGGGVFNSDGELIGPLFGTDNKSTYCTRNCELKRLLGVLSR